MFGVAAKQGDGATELLDRFRLAGPAEYLDQFGALVAVRAGQFHLHQLVRAQRRVEFRGQGVGHAALTDTHDRLAVMGTGTEEEALVTRKHGDQSGGVEGCASLSPLHREALASIKRELAAIVLFGIAFAWAVLHWTEGLEETVLLAGYGLGAAIWIRVRVSGLLRAVRDARRRDGDGSKQE
jgi:hypothetical protein